jgi:hypothetical protein
MPKVRKSAARSQEDGRSRSSVEYSFCETAVASCYSSWHIRALTKVGRKLGGGADTMSLCEREVSWDLDVPISAFHLSRNTCSGCLENYQALELPGDQDGKHTESKTSSKP